MLKEHLICTYQVFKRFGKQTSGLREDQRLCPGYREVSLALCGCDQVVIQYRSSLCWARVSLLKVGHFPSVWEGVCIHPSIPKVPLLSLWIVTRAQLWTIGAEKDSRGKVIDGSAEMTMQGGGDGSGGGPSLVRSRQAKLKGAWWRGKKSSSGAEEVVVKVPAQNWACQWGSATPTQTI